MEDNVKSKVQNKKNTHQGPSLWPKSFYGVIWGLIISLSIIINAFYLIPLEVPTFLITALVAGFLIWGGVMIYCYSCSSHKQINVACLKILSVSLLINFAYNFVN